MSPDRRRSCRLQTLRHTARLLPTRCVVYCHSLSLSLPLSCVDSDFYFTETSSRIWHSRLPCLVRRLPWLCLENFSWTKFSTWPAFLLRTWYLRILLLDSGSRLWRLNHPRLSLCFWTCLLEMLLKISTLLKNSGHVAFTWNTAYNLPTILNRSER